MTSATVDAGINKAASATIDIPACDSAHRIEPRTLVHLFYLESGYNIGTKPNDRSSSDGNAVDDINPPGSNDRPYRTLDTADLSNWRLLLQVG